MYSTKIIPIHSLPLTLREVEAVETASTTANRLNMAPYSMQDLNERMIQAEKELLKRQQQLTVRETEVLTAAQEKGYQDGHLLGEQAGQKAGHEEGYQTGYEQGMAQAKETYEAALTQLKQDWVKLATEWDDYLHDIRPEMTALICEGIYRLTAQHLTDNDQALAMMIQDIMTSLSFRQRLIIRVSPCQQEQVATYLKSQQSTGAATSLNVLADYTLKRTDCIIETEKETLDLQLDERYELLKSVMEELTKERSDGRETT